MCHVKISKVVKKFNKVGTDIMKWLVFCWPFLLSVAFTCSKRSVSNVVTVVYGWHISSQFLKHVYIANCMEPCR